MPPVEPNPTILPPAVDVVRNQASTENWFGPGTRTALYAREFEAPEKLIARLVSPKIAPVRLRLTPLPMFWLLYAAQSKAAPLPSPSRQ